MNTQELNNFIQNLRNSCSTEDGYFGFFYDDEDDYTSYVKANKEGLRLFASELLEVSLEIDKKESLTLSKDWHHNNSDFAVSRIELSKKTRLELDSSKKEEFKQTWKDKVTGYVMGGVLIFILISILVGAATIFSWLF